MQCPGDSLTKFFLVQCSLADYSFTIHCLLYVSEFRKPLLESIHENVHIKYYLHFCKMLEHGMDVLEGDVLWNHI